MPPVTRRQLKKAEPYSKENCPSERRTALSNLNESKIVTRSSIKKSNERIFKNGNIAKTETLKQKNEISKLDFIAKLEAKSEVKSEAKPEAKPEAKLESKTEASLITNEISHSSLDCSKDSTLYLSAREEITAPVKSEELYVSASTSQCNLTTENNHSELHHSATQELNNDSADVDEIFEIDETNWSDFLYMGCYAKEIFKYLRQREDMFIVTDYFNDQSELTPRHRAVVVDWLVVLQDKYELNHEVLYMSVRLIDLYLMKNKLPICKFQLLASAALLLSIKIDERGLGFPNILVRQSRYIFTEEELLIMERDLVKSLNCDINVPLSYVFLRRFARCMKCQMILLTLARYILETSLLEYKFVTVKESLKAAAALFLALKMFSKPVDEKDFYKYTGYTINDIKNTVIEFNNQLHTPKPGLNAVKEKYSHKVFFKVANRPPLNHSQLNFV